MSDWKPIKTAPKDGTRILVTDGKEFMSAQWTNGRFCQSPTAWEGSDEMGGLVSCEFDPTHWLLPELPKCKGKITRGKIKVLGRNTPYVGMNVTPEMLKRMQAQMEDIAMGKTTLEKMAAEFAAEEKKKVQ